MRMSIRIIAVLFVSILVTLPSEAAVERIVLEHADTLQTRHGIRYLIGHVKVRRGETAITSDRARYNPDTGEVILTGQVVMTEPGRRIKANRVTYNENSGDFEAVDDVDMKYGDSLRIRCNISRYYDMAQTADLYGKVIIDNLSDGARITGDHGKWNQTDDSGIIDMNPVYRLPDEEGDPPDTLVIVSKMLRFNRTEQTALFTGDVHLNHIEIRSISDSLLHLPDSSQTILTGEPTIWRDEDRLTGKRVELYYKDRELSKMIVKGDAEVISKPEFDDLHNNRLTGRILTMTTVDDSTKTVLMEGDAQAEYYVWSDDGVYHGVNLSASDSIEITLVSDRATGIRLNGRAECSFYPPGQEPEDILGQK